MQCCTCCYPNKSWPSASGCRQVQLELKVRVPPIAVCAFHIFPLSVRYRSRYGHPVHWVSVAIYIGPEALFWDSAESTTCLLCSPSVDCEVRTTVSNLLCTPGCVRNTVGQARCSCQTLQQVVHGAVLLTDSSRQSDSTTLRFPCHAAADVTSRQLE